MTSHTNVTRLYIAFSSFIENLLCAGYIYYMAWGIHRDTTSSQWIHTLNCQIPKAFLLEFDFGTKNQSGGMRTCSECGVWEKFCLFKYLSHQRKTGRLQVLIWSFSAEHAMQDLIKRFYRIICL